MKLNREDLLDVLKAIKPGLATREMLEQSTSFIFQKGRAYTYNDEIAISHPVDKGLFGAVSAKELYSLLDRLKDDELDVTIEDTEMRIKGKRSSAGIALQAEISLPLDELGKTGEWKPLPKTFGDAIAFCRFSASSDMIDPVLTCLNVNGGAIESCNRFQITRYDMGMAVETKDPLLLPASAAAILASYNPKEFTLTKGWIHFQNTAKTVFSCRMGEGEFPDIGKFMKAKGHEFEFPKELGEVLERAGVFSVDNELNDPSVRIDLSKGRLAVESSNGVGWFKERVRAKYDGPHITFEANPEFLIKMMPIIKTASITVGDKSLPNKTGMLKFKGDSFVHCFTMSIPEEE